MTVEVPERVSSLVRRRRRTHDPAAPLLEFVPPPRLELEPRTPARALDFFRLPRDLPHHLPDVPHHPAPAESTLADEVASIHWYHTIELPGGVVTPGEYDHRPLVGHYGLPSDLRGKRALDVATFDGFWAFELERRGAEVTAIDLARISQLDFPAQARTQLESEGVDVELGRGFAIAHTALGSKVERIATSVYDLDPARLGTFDVVHVGDLLLHLKCPVLALERIRSVCSGMAIIADSFAPELDKVPSRGLIRYLGGWSGVTWWEPSLNALGQMIVDAGFSNVRINAVYRLSRTWGEAGKWRAVLHAEV